MNKLTMSIVALSLTLWLTGCGGGSLGGGSTPSSTLTSVSATCTPSSITTNQTSSCTATAHYSDGSSGTTPSVTWSASSGTVNASGLFTPSGAATVTITATSTQDATKSGNASVTVTTVPVTITGVSLSCSPSSINDIQTTSCTPTVTGTGAFTNTVNLLVSPSLAGTLSSTSGVSSGTAVTFTPAGTGAATATITATSTADATKSGSTTVTVTLRTITINSTTGNIWLPYCSSLLFYNVTQAGIIKGDTIHNDPYQPATFTSTPPSTFTVSMGITDTGSVNTCSPGAYSEYVTGTDGAQSNTHYVPMIGHWNMWAGYNSTDEFQADPASGVVCKFKLADGSADGCITTYGYPFAATVDGNYLVASPLGSDGGFDVRNATTGIDTGGTNRNGDVVTGITAKNGIAGYTQSTKQMVSFFNYGQSVPVISDATFGTAPASIAMSTGCSSDPNTASAFAYDEEGTTLYRIDAVKASSGGNVTASTIGSVALTGFSPASQIPTITTLARFVVTWDSTCKAAVLAPVVTGTNSDGSKNYSVEMALVDMTAGTMHQIGTYVSDSKIPSTVIRIAADPAGGNVIIASTNEGTGTTNLVKVSWTMDSSENPTFTTTALSSAPPTGVYGVSLGVLPNGKISVGQRQQHYVLANQ